jgi:hypothetical protein
VTKIAKELGVLIFVEKPEAGAIPAFRLPKWKDGVVPKLPVPEVPFSLDLFGTEVIDGRLKELANLKNLTRLCLCDIKTTLSRSCKKPYRSASSPAADDLEVRSCGPNPRSTRQEVADVC